MQFYHHTYCWLQTIYTAVPIINYLLGNGFIKMQVAQNMAYYTVLYFHVQFNGQSAQCTFFKIVCANSIVFILSS